MAENKQKKASEKTTVQVSPGLLLAIKNEQNRLLNTARKSITQGDLLNKAWRCYLADSVPDTEHNPPSMSVPVVLNDTLHGLEGTWKDAMLRLLGSGVGVRQFQQLLAIFLSNDKEVIEAISSNLTVFSRVETVSRALDERASAALPESRRDDLSKRVQEALEGAAEDVRRADEAINQIKEHRKPDSRDRRRTGGS